MATGPGDFVLTLAELRVVTRYAAECAQESLAVFERNRPHDPRARAAVDAAASAYLHPLAKASQVGHILRAAAFTARALELAGDGDEDIATQVIDRARRRATPALVDVLRRYPPAPEGKSRVDRLWKALDTALRTG